MKVKNWPKFQHFKDRRPPWIKLYRDLLDDDEYFNLPPINAKTLTLLWLLASEDDTRQGLLPPLKKIAFRLRMSEKTLKSIISQLSHWLIHDDINEISNCHQLGPSETEAYSTETYTKETETNGYVVVNDFEQFWKAYPRKIGKKDALKAWGKAKDKPQISLILEAIGSQVRSEQWTKDNGQYIPNPSTWINQGRWDDQPDIKAPTVMEAFLQRGERNDTLRLCTGLVAPHVSTVGQAISNDGASGSEGRTEPR